ncbi:hypothetical protein M1N88_00625 [Dehalococcoidia bacterium]|nr:hypothetical protein [Dehalococcoidia bacterium]
MYLLDTDILSNLLKRAPSTTLIAKLASMPIEQQFTSSITLGELVYGAYRLRTRASAFHVSGKDGILNKESDPEHFKDDEIGNQEVSYGIDFTDWAEWLGMEIDQESFSKYSELDIIGHCLWEVTFYGFIQDDIRKTIDRITNYQSPVERSGQSLPFMAFSSQHEGTYPYIYDEKEIKTGVIVPIRLWEQIRGEIEKGKKGYAVAFYDV